MRGLRGQCGKITHMNITLVRLGDSPRQAFVRGLWKGMAAPLMLFGANRAALAPLGELPPVPRVDPITLPERITALTDLERIGLDFWAAVRRHEQENAQQPADRHQGE